MNPAEKIAEVLNGYLHNAIRMGAVDFDAPKRMANAAVAALGIAEEWGVVTDMGVERHGIPQETAKRAAEKWPDMTVRHRHVTAWTATEENH